MSDLRPIAVIDYETDPFKHGRLPRAFACGFYDGKTYESIYNNDEKEVLRWARKKVSKFKGTVYAHNGGRFDFLGFLFRNAGKFLHGEPVEMRDNRIVKMAFGEAEIRDSFAILPAPLKAYDKGEISYEKFERSRRDKHREEIMRYLRRDCISLHELVIDFVQLHGLRPVTAAAAGMAHLKSLGYEIPTLNSRQDEHFRQWYFGGRVEASKPGLHHGHFIQEDIKSAYPFAMTHDHACTDSFTFIASPARVLDTDFVLFKGESRGAFPVRGKEGISYPHGRGEFFTTGWEYLVAIRLRLARGNVLFVERPVQTTNFKRYVDHWFGEKETAEREGNRSGRLIAKIMLNAVYGKFAQRPDRYREFLFVPLDAKLTRKNEIEGWEEEYVDEENGFAIWSKPSSRPAFYVNVATAASITGFVRAMLMRKIKERKPYCVDTDAAISSIRRRTTGTVPLGGWGIEAEGDRLYVAGKKLYALRLLSRYAKEAGEAKKKGYFWDGKRAWKIASKGCRLTPEEMKIVAQGGEVVACNQAPTYSVRNFPRFIKRTIKRTA